MKEIADRALKKGLMLSDGSFYNSKGKNYNSIRMGFASMDLKEAAGILKSVIAKM